MTKASTTTTLGAGGRAMQNGATAAEGWARKNACALAISVAAAPVTALSAAAATVRATTDMVWAAVAMAAIYDQLQG